MPERKPGRPSLGDRVRKPVRLRMTLEEPTKKYLEGRGMSFNQLVDELVAARLEDAGLLPSEPYQEELPLGA